MVIVPSSITDIKGSSIDLQIKSSHIGYRDQAFKINDTTHAEHSSIFLGIFTTEPSIGWCWTYSPRGYCSRKVIRSGKNI